MTTLFTRTLAVAAVPATVAAGTALNDVAPHLVIPAGPLAVGGFLLATLGWVVGRAALTDPGRPDFQGNRPRRAVGYAHVTRVITPQARELESGEGK